MRTRRTIGLGALALIPFLALALPTTAEQAGAGAEPVAAEPAETGADRPASRSWRDHVFTVEDVAWLEGDRSGWGFNGRIDEYWSAPRDGAIMGAFRFAASADGPVRLYEFLLIEQDDEGVVMRFKHILPGWAPVEDEPIEMRLTRVEDRRLIFESDTSTKPKRIVYRRYADDDRLTVDVVAYSDETDDSRSQRITLRPRSEFVED